MTAKVMILRMIPYRESSLIINTIEAGDEGRIDFIVRGAKKRKGVSIDLFRELEIEFSGRGDLKSLNQAELLDSHDGLADFPENFITASNLAALLLRNSQPGIPCPSIYRAMSNALRAMSTRTAAEWKALVEMTLLFEHGMLPEPEDEGRRELIQSMLDAAVNGAPPPDLPESYWRDLEGWLEKLLLANGLLG